MNGLGKIAILCACAAASPALAHHPPGAPSQALAATWNLDPWIVVPLGASLVLYALGVARLWRRAGKGRGIATRECAMFAAGWLVLAAALVTPIDALGGALFSMHMVQHELMMVVAAPLFVLARPVEAWTWGLPQRWRGPLAAAVSSRWLSGLWKTVTEPVGAWVFHALAIWLWHVPVLFGAALANDGVHTLQHATFLASALAFWWSVLRAAGRRNDATALASVFTTMLHTGALGALLAFSPTAWYGHYVDAAAFGLTAVEDQQVGGLVMWVPGGVAYLIAALVLVCAWILPATRSAPARRAAVAR